MSFLDAAMDSYKLPAAEDLDIALPAWRGQKKDAEAAGEPRDLGQHGGAADGAHDSTDAHSDVAASAPEPVPQRDDPDDGEHTDSTEAEVATRAQQAAAAAAAAEVPEAAAEPVEAPPVELVDQEVEEVPVLAPAPVRQAITVKQELAAIPGSDPRTFQKTGFSSGGAETLTVTRFPQVLIDRLRLTLAPAVGGEFAEAMSSTALITAFLIAKTGVELDVDENTASAVDVFRQVDPRMRAVEEKIDDMAGDVGQLADAMKLSLNRVADIGNIVDVLDFAMSYLIADRVAGLTTTDTNESNVDVTQKKVLVARDNIRKKAREQRKIERQRDGRRMS